VLAHRFFSLQCRMNNYFGCTGDCCEDTCTTKEGSYLQCGMDGYYCKDANSTKCDPTLTLKCPSSSYKKTSDDDGSKTTECTADETKYRLVMYDSFGDGWEKTKITINATTGATTGQKLTPVYQGGLENGAEGTVYICLSLNPMCYDVDVSGGNWGREASWLIRSAMEGSPAIASGGGLMQCTFSVAGGSCSNTCTGKSNRDPSKDSDYKDFKEMYNCIDKRCSIQANVCREDAACKKCFLEDVPDYCFSIESFLAVTDCAACRCSNTDVSEFCADKRAPGIVPTVPSEIDDDTKPCTPAETQKGSWAVQDFSRCMENFDKYSLLMTDFDQNNFGALDTFEACAHSFQDNQDHGGHTANGCMVILKNAMTPDTADGKPTETIAELATMLYNDGASFCDCAKQASVTCPLCPSFYNFKTLLYESLDACLALDQIDCDAWNEFQKPCKGNIGAKFGSIDLSKKEQCDYMRENCGGAGVFPSFRRLDCQKELPADSWDFYNLYSSRCVGDTRPVGPVTPSPTVPVDPKALTKPPTPYQPVKPSNIKPVGPTPYSPPSTDSNKRPSYKSPEEKRKKSHWFRNLLLIGLFGGIGCYIYKHQADGFNFVRYRRMNRFGFGGDGSTFGMDDGDMYSGLALESSTNFEPPSLPPTPMFMPNNGGYGA
jgi:hypothetical protein